MINLLHIFAVPLAAWRFTEFIAQDRITLAFRQHFPGYLWICPRCLSVWAGAIATLLYVKWPWLNWPFALAWLYLWQQDNRAFKRQLQKRSFLIVVEKEDHLNLVRQELTGKELDAIAEILPRVREQVK